MKTTLLSVVVFLIAVSANASDAPDHSDIRRWSAMLLQQVGMLKSESFYDDAANLVKAYFGNATDPGSIQHFSKEAFLLEIKFMKLASLPESEENERQMRQLASEIAMMHKTKLPQLRRKYADRLIMSPSALELLKGLVRNTAPLSAPLIDRRGKPGYPQSNSSLVKELSRHGNEKLYALAGYIRCIADAQHLLPKKSEVVGHPPQCDAVCQSARRKQMYAQCENWKTAKVAPLIRRETLFMEFYINEAFEVLSCKYNVYETLKDMAIYFDSLWKAVKSKSRAKDDFMTSLRRSTRFHATATLYGNIMKCREGQLRPESLEQWNKMKEAFKALFKYLLPKDKMAAPNTAGVETLLRKIEARFRALNSSTNLLDELENFAYCVYPRDFDYEQLVGLLRGTVDQRREFLERLRPTDEAARALYVVIFEHMKMIRRRNGLREPAEEFVEKVISYFIRYFFNGYEAVSGYEERENQMTAELRAQFLGLPATAKYELIDHFPYRSLFYLTRMF